MSDGMTREERAWCSGVTPEKPLSNSFVYNASKGTSEATTDDFEDRMESRLKARLIGRLKDPEIDVPFVARQFNYE